MDIYVLYIERYMFIHIYIYTYIYTYIYIYKYTYMLIQLGSGGGYRVLVGEELLDQDQLQIRYQVRYLRRVLASGLTGAPRT